MGYKQSAARRRWTDERLARLDVLATAHASVGAVSGPGRPLTASKPLAHAYIIGMLGEFQGFARDLHDIAVERLVTESGAEPHFATILTKGLKSGRGVDRGNATTNTLRSDFARLGLTPFELSRYNQRWSVDVGALDRLIQLRNVLGHSNEAALDSLLESRLVNDTVSWARARQPLLKRYVRALDMLVWDHLRAVIGRDPWA